MYRSYWNERHEPYRDYNKLNKDEQKGYWNWRPLLDILAEIHEALGLPAPVIPQIPPDPFAAQLEAVVDAAPPAFSFTFGIPSSDAMARLKARALPARELVRRLMDEMNAEAKEGSNRN